QGFNVSVEALQSHGGYGYCTEYGIEQFVRDTKIATIYEGTNAIQAIDLVMRKILRDGGKSLTVLTQKIVASVQSLDPQFKKEQELFGKVLMSAQTTMQKITEWAKGGKHNMILQNCTDFLNLAAQMVMAWQLMEAAKLAAQKVGSASGDDKAYYESKIVDFKIYCSQFLVHNLSLARTITDFEEDMSTLEI
ncbi:MAG TPA: acyl-CoA dehydrogenase, partial [Bacteriovoracaceae bacterium]|nr:acyl-CoA dehydrogenase [Bacteriovoracaceae bacterium]